MKCKCYLCKHEWDSRTDDPVACPNCKRYNWKAPTDPIIITSTNSENAIQEENTIMRERYGPFQKIRQSIIHKDPFWYDDIIIHAAEGKITVRFDITNIFKEKL